MDIAIIGGGAAGFMAAITAAEANPEARVVIYEKQPKVLNKVRISGGGRCNVTHNEPDVQRFAAQYPRGRHFIRKLMMEFGQAETIAWFEQRGVRLKAEADGRMFPITDNSETIIRCLADEATRLGIRVSTGLGLVAFGKSDLTNRAEPFTLTLSDQSMVLADRLIIATGGKPKMEEYALVAKQHEIVPPLPSLFTFHAPKSFLLPLMGVSVARAIVRIPETKDEWQGPVLITHWGFSGPAILKLSALAARELAALQYRFTLIINWLPGLHEASCRTELIKIKEANARKVAQGTGSFGLATRLWAAFLQEVGIHDQMRWADVTKIQINHLATLLTMGRFEINGKSTFKEEFVTSGGISLNAINQKTLESKTVAGLYFAGEILDVDGITGGFNFQNAWTTGYVAGRNSE